MIRLNFKAIIRLFKDLMGRIKKLRGKRVHLRLKINTRYSLSGWKVTRWVIGEAFQET